MYKILANTIFLGKDVHFLPECHSTNDMALQLIKNRQANEGTLVITDHQTQGKGQRGNRWEVEPGKNLTFSLVLCPRFLDISEQFYLNMLIANSLRELLCEYLPGLMVKWPNDLIVPHGGKVGGILIENVVGASGWEYAVIGIGINVNQTNALPVRAVSMKSLTRSEFDLTELLRLLITCIEQGYLKFKKRNLAQVRADFIHHLFQYEEWSAYEAAEGQFQGKIVGLGEDGQLLVEKETSEIKQFGIKELRFLW